MPESKEKTRTKVAFMNPKGLAFHIHLLDNVVVALRDLSAGQEVGGVQAAERVPAGHKMACRFIRQGKAIVKYGSGIGVALGDIRPGEHVHTHNVASALPENCKPDTFAAAIDAGQSGAEDPRSLAPVTFEGFRRANGSVGVRNEIWIINTVACVNHAAARIAERATRELCGERERSKASTPSVIRLDARSLATISSTRNAFFPAWQNIRTLPAC